MQSSSKPKLISKTVDSIICEQHNSFFIAFRTSQTDKGKVKTEDLDNNSFSNQNQNFMFLTSMLGIKRKETKIEYVFIVIDAPMFTLCAV